MSNMSWYDCQELELSIRDSIESLKEVNIILNEYPSLLDIEDSEYQLKAKKTVQELKTTVNLIVKLAGIKDE